MIEINAAFQDNCTDLGLLGRADEGRTRSIVFDCKDILGEYPDAKMIAVITQPCTGKKYSASLSERGTDRILVIERSDTAYPGIINIELRAVIDDDGNKRKSAFYKGKIEASMIGEGDAPGAPVRDMLDRAEERLERLSNIRAEAETLKPDEDATASYDNDNAILKLGIPQGKDGGNVDQDPTDEYCGIVNSRNDSVIDQTLTMAGQAADAKACGERFSEKQDVLTDSDRQSIVRIGIVSGAAWTSAEKKAARIRMGADGDYVLIESITLTEGTTYFERDSEPDGTPYDLIALKVIVKFVPGQTSGGFYFYGYNGENRITGGASQLIFMPDASGVEWYRSTAVADVKPLFGLYDCTISQGSQGSAMNVTRAENGEYQLSSTVLHITKFNFHVYAANGPTPCIVGTEIKIYGVRA